MIIERSGKNEVKGIIIDYENQSTDTTVYFKIIVRHGYLSSAQWSEGDMDKIEKDFKLTTTKHTSLTNIHLYNEDNTITKYDDVELDSKKDRDYEKYHSDWAEEEIFGSRKSTIDAKEIREMYNKKSLPNYYLILGLTNNASSIEIKNQYRKLAKQYHPDKSKSSSEEKMTGINKAYEMLGYKPKYSLKDGIKNYIEFIKNNKL